MSIRGISNSSWPTTATPPSGPAAEPAATTRVPHTEGEPIVVIGRRPEPRGLLGWISRIFSAIGRFFSRLFSGGHSNRQTRELQEESPNAAPRRQTVHSSRPGAGLREPRHVAPRQNLGDPSGMRADVVRAIRSASAQTGVNERLLFVLAQIESGGDPNAESRSGTYVGLFQIGPSEWQRWGGGSAPREDPDMNALVAARSIADRQRRGVIPPGLPPEEQALFIYLTHQQGEAGAAAHWTNPDGVAWQNIRRYYSSDGRAQRAITGNVSSEYARRYGTRMTSRQFIDYWRNRMQIVSAQVYPNQGNSAVRTLFA
ncbi:MAG: transglycosylase SLT domain-containing protein [Myxococcota bacterium]